MPLDAESPNDRELVLTRSIDAPASALYRCWTEPELLKQWFAPAPFTTPLAELDVRPGGASLIVMKSPEGDEMPNRGVYLEVVPGRRLVFTDSFVSAWQPSEHPFMTAELSFDDLGGGRTRYVARVRHPTPGDRERHEQMGFHQGWGLCTDQLAALARRV